MIILIFLNSQLKRDIEKEIESFDEIIKPSIVSSMTLECVCSNHSFQTEAQANREFSEI